MRRIGRNGAGLTGHNGPGRARLFAVSMLVGLAWGSGPVQAENGWSPLRGGEIGAALSGRTVGFADGTRQTFRAGGVTTRDGTGAATGRWKVEGRDLCLSWPPEDSWACGGVERHDRGQRLRLPGPGGRRAEALFLDLR